MPQATKMINAMQRMAFDEEKRSGKILLWIDTYTSLKRLLFGVIIAATVGLILGLANGLIPYVRANLSPYVIVLSLIPPLAQIRQSPEVKQDDVCKNHCPENQRGFKNNEFHHLGMGGLKR